MRFDRLRGGWDAQIDPVGFHRLLDAGQPLAVGCERISKVINAGAEAVQKHIADGNGLEFFVWLALIFLKVHLKDRDFRIHRDLRKPDDRIADFHDWQALHHMHCIARCFVNGATLEKEVFGSIGVFAAKTEGWREQFDYGDLVEAQTMLLRLGDVVIITTFDDAGGALQGAMPRLERIEGPLSEVQAREVMVDFAFVNLSLNKRPRFYTECDIKHETLTEKAKMPPHFELGELDYKLRGRLLRRSLGDGLKQIRCAGKTQQEIEQAIDDGLFTFLFDDIGKFIKQSFTTLSTQTQ
jgi:hypothetical protein